MILNRKNFEHCNGFVFVNKNKSHVTLCVESLLFSIVVTLLPGYFVYKSILLEIHTMEKILSRAGITLTGNILLYDSFFVNSS